MKKIFSPTLCLFIVIAMSSCSGGSSKQLTDGGTISSGGDSMNQLGKREIPGNQISPDIPAAIKKHQNYSTFKF